MKMNFSFIRFVDDTKIGVTSFFAKGLGGGQTFFYELQQRK